MLRALFFEHRACNKPEPDMRISISRFLFAVAVIIIAQHNCSAQSFAMYRNNPQLTGVTAESPVYGIKGIKFTYKAGGPIRGIPAALGGMLYFGGGDGYFCAINGQTGAEQWKFKTGGAVYSSPYVTQSTLYFTSRDGNIYALQTGNGKQVWKFTMDKDLGAENYWDNYLSSPVIVDNTLYVGGGDGYLYAINKGNGKLLWKYNAGARIRVTPAVFEDNIVFGNNAGYIIDVSKTTGKMVWQFKTDGASNTFESKNNDRTSIFCAPTVADGVVVTGGRDGIAYGIDLATGKEKWRDDHKGPWILSTAVKDGVAYIGCGSDLLVVARELQTGKELWRFKCPSAVFSSITVAGDMLYFNDIHFSGNTHAVNSKTGIEQWKFPMGAKSFSTPIIANGMVYTGAENGVLYALEANPGMTSATVTQQPVKIVYRQGPASKDDYTDFQNGVDEFIKNYFIACGYKLVDEKELAQVMNDQLTNKTKSVIVFADNRFPAAIEDASQGKPLALKYLEAGGKIAIFGLNPMAYTRDSSGNVDAYNDSLPSAVFGLSYPGKNFIRGIYQAQITPTGKQHGLASAYTTVSNFTVITPGAATTVLATDEFGSATEWIKNYGGPDGTGLLQLNLPSNEITVSLGELRAAIEWGVAW